MEHIWEEEGFFFGEDDFDSKMKELALPVLKGFEEGYFEHEGARLHYYAGINPEERASVVICHGFCEFFAKYHELAYYLYKAGYSIFFMEQRGHGYSTRADLDDESKVYVRSFDEYVSDLHGFVEDIVKKKSTTGRLVLFGHSMGGCISSLYEEKYPGDFETVILSSPMHKMSYGGKPEWMAVLAVLYSKLFRKGKEYAPGQRSFNPENWFARSSALSFARWNYVQELRRAHREYRTFGGTYAWTAAAIKASKKSVRNAGKIEKPVLLIESGLDTMVNNGAHYIFAKKAKQVGIQSFPASKHEAFNAEKEERESFYKAVFEWLETHV